MSSFSIRQKAFGAHKSLILSHTSGLEAEVLPFYGAALNALFLPDASRRHQNVIDGYQPDGYPGHSGALYKGVILFPFPNRLKDGLWQFENLQGQFPINEAARSNALHGSLYQAEFQVVQTQVAGDGASCTLLYESASGFEFYPFAFSVEVKYTLQLEYGLSVHTKVKNLDTKTMPFGLGWHPYFSTGTKIDAWNLHLPACRALEVDERMIPTGKVDSRTTEAMQKFVDGALLEDLSLDTGFMASPSAVFTVSVIDPKLQIGFEVWQENQAGSFNYIQIYTPPDRKSIAIEPMTCRANAFQDADAGLLWLASGAESEFTFGIRSVRKME